MDQRLKLMWHCEDKIFEIGELVKKESRYYFSYIEDKIKEAAECGFEPLTGFPRIGSKYYSEKPFRLFSMWAGSSADDEELSFESFKGLSYDNFRFEQAE